MKRSITTTGIFLSIFTSLEASSSTNSLEQYVGYMWLITGFIVAFLVYLVIRYKKELSIKTELIEQKDEKIQWLREIAAKNDHNHNTKIQDMEKSVAEMTHQIDTLEHQVKEGTKNQVVAKIEELEAKRSDIVDRMFAAKESN
jgi:uncharacterized membrane protein YgaE (UPF0421/DUF939 family)